MFNKLVISLFVASVICHVESQIFSKQKYRFSLRSNIPQNQGHGKVGDCLYNMCEHIPNYPNKNIKSIIEKNKDLHSYFGNVIEPANPIQVEDRFGAADYEPFCKTVDVTVLPKFMKDVDGVERSIANVDGYQQVVKFQTCDFSQGEQCFAASLLDRKTLCVQKFHVIKLLTAFTNNNTLEYRDFEVPTTCVCTYKNE